MIPGGVVQRQGRPAIRLSKSAEVFEGIKKAIMLGELAPDMQLLELELADRFQCSQGPVREALLNLQDDGLVYRLPHRGTRVSGCTRDEAVEMFHIRHAIETRAMPRAIGRLGRDGLHELTALVEQMEAAAAAGDEYLLAERDRDFHRRLFRAADLTAVEPLLNRCILHNHRFKILHSGAQRDLVETAERHRIILAALESKDVSAAVQAIGHHVATIVEFGPALFAPPGEGAQT